MARRNRKPNQKPETTPVWNRKSSSSWREVIVERIVAHKCTLHELAAQSGINVSVLSRLVHGQRSMNLDTAERLCAVLGLRLVAENSTALAASGSAVTKQTGSSTDLAGGAVPATGARR